MKKTLTAIALFTALAGVTSGANARGVFEGNPMHVGRSEGLQNYYYYFGSNCCGSTVADRGGRPCAAPACAPAAPTCDTCPPINIVVPMEERCAPCPQPCDPCGGGMGGILPWNW